MTDIPSASSSSAVDLSLSVGENGIAWLRMRPLRGSAVPLTLDTLRDLEGELARVEASAGEGGVRILVLATAPPHPHLVGYDLDELRYLQEEQIVAWSHEAQRVLRRLETLPIPSVAAIHGEWLGGAAEVALACSYRVGTRSGGTVVGFPQARLGFIPAWGGTVRLPRLVGLQEALRLVLTGESLSMTEAADIGLIDQALDAGDFEAGVKRFAEGRMEGRRARRRHPLRRRLLDDTAPGRRLLSAGASRRHLGGDAPSKAARIALDLMAETLALPLETAFARESAAAGRLLLSKDAQGRLHSQRLTDRARARLPIGGGDFEDAAVLGAGQTGSDLAHLLAAAGAHARIKDSSKEVVRGGVARAKSRIQWEEAHGRISRGQARRRADRIEAASGFGGFGTLDIVIAAPEGLDRSVEELLLEVEPHVTESCLLAYHDWTTSPTRVQRTLKRPDRVIGLAPSFPIERFPLLEIVPGTLTAPDVVSTARRLARRFSRTGVVVSDQTPTPGTRLLAVYLAEAARLLQEGATVDQVDAAVEEFGFEVGPFKRIDAIGGPRALRMLDQLTILYGERTEPTALLRQFAGGGATFFRYRSGRPAAPNADLPAGRSTGAEPVSELVRRRLLLALVNEASRILEEGCVSDPGDLEVISILGLGFPKALGGILFHAESHGLQNVVEELLTAADRNGRRFAPAGLLRDLASTGRGFFGSSRHTPLDSGMHR